MSANLDLVRSIYADWARRDPALNRMAPDVVFDLSRRLVDPEIYHGHAGLLKLREGLYEAWSEFRQEPKQYSASGNRVLAVLSIRGTGRTSGVKVVEQVAHVWTVDRGKVARLEYFGDPVEAQRTLSDVGLRQESHP